MPSRPLPAADLDHVLAHAEPAFLSLQHARLFLTGGTGFFGHWLLETLLHANRELSLHLDVTALTRSAAAFRAKSPHIAHDPAVTLLEGDIRTFAFPNPPFTHILHAATDSSAGQDNTSILAGTERILQLAEKTRSSQLAADSSLANPAPRLLYVSTGAVYGRSTNRLFTPEDFPLPQLPAGSYEAAKQASERLCLAGYPDPGSPGLQPRVWSGLTATHDGYPDPSASGLTAKRNGYPDPSGSGLIAAPKKNAGGFSLPHVQPVIARCFAFVGPHLPLDQHFAIGNFLAAALAGTPIAITGDGTPRRSWLYMADLAAWLWTLLTQAEPGSIYNVGSDEAFTIAEAAHLTAATLNPTIPIEIATTPVPNAPRNNYVPDIRRAHHDLGLSVTIPLAEALRRTASWLRS